MSSTVLITLLIVSGLVALTKILTKHRRERWHNEAQRAAPSARERELEDELGQLRERIHVLERIATDDRVPRELADEIEKLRDQ